MQRYAAIATWTVIVLILFAVTTSAVLPLSINYQARLADNQGDPVPDSSYSMEFRFYADSTSGTPEMTRMMEVNTHNGYFNAAIGEGDSLDLGVFGQRTFFEVAINGETVSPRMPMNHVPYSAVAQRVLGDIQTGIGLLRLMEPLESFPAAEMTADGIQNEFKINWMEPLEYPPPAFDFKASSEGGIFQMVYMEPLETPAVKITAGNGGGIGNVASMIMFNPQPEPPAQALLEMNTSESGGRFAMAAPQAGGPGDDITDPVLLIYADSTGGGIELSDAIGKCWGTEPSPFSPGAIMYFIDPSTSDTNMTLGSDGTIKAQKGDFGFNTYDSGINNLSTGSLHNITGNYSFAGGYLAQVYHNNCFVWSDYVPYVDLTTTADNQFLVRATGGVIFYTNGTMNTGVSLSPGSSSWNSIIPPFTADNSDDLDGSDVLGKIERLSIRRYAADSETQHISSSPEEFNELFNVGSANDQISPQDQSAVALAGIQEMINIINDLRAKNAELESRIAELERR